MKIALDAMGGDYAPDEVVKGAVAAAKEHKVEIVLVGRQATIQKELAKQNPGSSGLAIVDATEVIGMDEPPTLAIRQKKNSSIAVGMNLLKKGDVSAFVSAGNSGAIVTAALLLLGREKGIKRPALGHVFPLPSGPVLFLDVGANPDCKPIFLVQFAQMGSAYMEKVFGLNSPRIGLLNNGEEETKGNQLIRETHRLLKSANLNFIGNVEGQDIPKGVADVVVTDGFTGNIMIKITEGAGKLLIGLLSQALTSSPQLRVAASLLIPALRAIADRFVNYTEYGGAPLLGVKGNVVIAHGRSDAQAIKSAIRTAKQTVEQKRDQIA